MPLIDEQGRVFGKINIIDLFVLIFLIGFIVPTCWFGYKIATRPKIKKPAIITMLKSEYEKEITILKSAYEKEQVAYEQLKAQTNNFLREYSRFKKYFPE